MSSQKKMLIVDDVEINRAILKELFSEEFDIMEATNGAEAMSILESNIDNIAIVLLDVVMPIMDGFSTLSEMEKKGYIGKFPVIAMTAGDGTNNDISIVDMGAEDIMSKPFIATLVKKRCITSSILANIANL
jgi:Response regulators consisting of a CheY-like receiver domain and a winged-helix DNA-binding domain